MNILIVIFLIYLNLGKIMTKKKKKQGQSQNEYNYDYRYPSNWLEISRDLRQKYPQCCLCHTKPSEEIHHMYYRNNRGNGDLLLDKVKPGIHVSPLCQSCHHKAHQIKGGNGKNKITYILHPTDNSYNKNTPAFAKQLKLGFKILYG